MNITGAVGMLAVEPLAGQGRQRAAVVRQFNQALPHVELDQARLNESLLQSGRTLVLGCTAAKLDMNHLGLALIALDSSLALSSPSEWRLPATGIWCGSAWLLDQIDLVRLTTLSILINARGVGARPGSKQKQEATIDLAVEQIRALTGDQLAEALKRAELPTSSIRQIRDLTSELLEGVPTEMDVAMAGSLLGKKGIKSLDSAARSKGGKKAAKAMTKAARTARASLGGKAAAERMTSEERQERARKAGLAKKKRSF